MSLSVKGKISSKLNVESGTSKSGNERKKQSFLLDTGAQYNPEICFQLFGDEKIAILNHYNIGDEVEVPTPALYFSKSNTFAILPLQIFIEFSFNFIFMFIK